MKKIFILCFAMLTTLVSIAQLNSNVKSVRFKPAIDTATFTPKPSGTVARHLDGNLYIVDLSGVWVPLGGGGGGAVNFASNGLSLSGDTTILGGTLNQNTDISGFNDLTLGGVNYLHGFEFYTGSANNQSYGVFGPNYSDIVSRTFNRYSVLHLDTLNASFNLLGSNFSIKTNPLGGLDSERLIIDSIGQWKISINNSTGTAGQVLTANGTGYTEWQTLSIGAAGNDTEIQYNTGGNLDASSNMTFLQTTTNGYINVNDINLGNIPLYYTTGGQSTGIGVENFNKNLSIYGASGTALNNSPTGVLTISGGVAYQDSGNGNGGEIVILSGENLGSGTGGNITINNNGDNTGVGGSLVITENNASPIMGLSTLVGGTVTINTNKITVNSRIFLTVQTAGGTQGFLRVSSRTAGTSFTVTSTSALETSTISWLIIEP